MLSRKKKSPPDEQSASSPPRPKKRWWRKVIKYSLIALLLLVVSCIGATVWLFQTESGQTWLVAKVNAIMAPAPDKKGLSLQITHLSGSLPTDFRLGINLYDPHGIWLSAPDNQFIWKWRDLPDHIHIQALALNRVDISRLPDLPPETPRPENPENPMTVNDIKNMLRQAASFLQQKHWWLPEVNLDDIRADVILPPELIPGQPQERLATSARLKAAFTGSSLNADLEAGIRNNNSSPVKMPSVNFDSLTLRANFQAGEAPENPGLASHVDIVTRLERPRLEVTGIPADFLGEAPEFSMQIKALALTSEDSPQVGFNLEGPNLKAGHVQLASHGVWRTDSSWKTGRIAGPLDFRSVLELSPVTDAGLLEPIRSPATLTLALDGNFPQINLALNLDCMDISSNGHELANLKLNVAANDILLPLPENALQTLEKENHMEFSLAATLDKQIIELNSQIFFQAVKNGGDTTAQDTPSWRAGLRNLRLDAAGIKGAGNGAILLLAGEKPGIDGTLELSIDHWQEISSFLPDKKLSGDVGIKVSLSSGLPKDLGNPLISMSSDAFPARPTLRQAVNVELKIPEFAMQASDSASSVYLKALDGTIKLTDLFDKPEIDASLQLGTLQAADMDIGARLKAAGPLEGPFKADISTTGAIASKISAEWKPGEATINTLEILADAGKILKSPARGKKKYMGIRANGPAHVFYGDNGIAIKNLDCNILPSGRLQANGGISSDKLDLKVDLVNLDFKPWQALVPQIPAGAMDMKVRLNGSPARPGGEFRLAVNKLVVPASQLPPISLALTGGIKNSGASSALAVNLDLDPATIKALGGNIASVTARLPLVFGPDGIPRPDMQGNLAAKIRWDGAIGPLWNLVPMADRRLNGRLAINLDAAGNLDKPKITGGIKVQKARFEDVMLGILITDINVDLNLTDKTMKSNPHSEGMLDSLPGGMTLVMTASDGRGGTVKVDGNGQLDGSRLDINASMNRLRPLRRRDVHVELSGNASVTGSATDPNVKGEITVNQGEVLLNNIAITGSITTLPITASLPVNKKTTPVSLDKTNTEMTSSEQTASTATAKEGFGHINMRIIMLPRFTVEGRGLSSIWKADLLVSGALTDPKITGNISSVRGNFDFLGKNFALSKGIVFFGGGAISNPLLDIDLTNETPELTAHILLSGPVNKMKFQLTSDPVLPRDDILSRVLFGKSVNDLSQSEALQLGLAVAQLAGFGGGTGIMGMAKKALGVDVLRLGTSDSAAASEPGDSSADGTTLEVGKYLNDYTYVGVQQGLKPDSTAFIIQLEITPRTSLEIRTEQNNTWGGIKWKYNY